MVKTPRATAGDTGSSPGWGDPLDEGTATHSRILGAWWATVHGVAESGVTERLTFCTIRVVQANVINQEAHTEDGNPNGNLEFRVSEECGALKGVRQSASGLRLHTDLQWALQYSRRLSVALPLFPREQASCRFLTQPAGHPMTQHIGSIQLPLYTGLPSPPAQKNFFLDVSSLGAPSLGQDLEGSKQITKASLQAQW